MTGRDLKYSDIVKAERRLALLPGRPGPSGLAFDAIMKGGRRVTGRVLEYDFGAMYPWRIQLTNGAIERFNITEVLQWYKPWVYPSGGNTRQ